MPRRKSRRTSLREAKKKRAVQRALLGFDPAIQAALGRYIKAIAAAEKFSNNVYIRKDTSTTEWRLQSLSRLRLCRARYEREKATVLLFRKVTEAYGKKALVTLGTTLHVNGKEYKYER